MELFLIFSFVVVFIRIVLLSYRILSLLISLEFIILILFTFMYIYLYGDRVIELIIFIVLSTGERVLGIVLMLLKVSFEGRDRLDELEV